MSNDTKAVVNAMGDVTHGATARVISDYEGGVYEHAVINYVASDGVRVSAYVHPDLAHLGAAATDQPDWHKGRKRGR